MSTLLFRQPHAIGPGRFGASQSGFSLIELMIAILIALFLIGGIIVVEQGVHTAYGNQSGIAQLQDEERFAMTMLTDTISSAGYFPNPTLTSEVAALPSTGSPLNMEAGQSLTGAAGPPDSVYARFMTASGDGTDFCDGTTNTSGGNLTYTSYLYVASNELYCQVQPGTGSAWNAAVPLVNGVTNMQIWYGVNTSGTDNNVDTYIPSSSMTAANWQSVSSVMIVLTFLNPLYGSPGQQETVTFRRVIGVMGRD
jgi:type IV pilus assembly protein PilW